MKKMFVILSALLGLILGPIAFAATFDLPSEVVLNEDSSTTLNLTQYLSLGSGESLVNFTLNCTPQNIVVSINQNNWLATISPKQNWNGQETINIVAYYNASGTIKFVSDSSTVVVKPVNDAPVLNLPTNLKWRVGEAINYQVNATDVDGDQLVFTADAGDWSSFLMDSAGVISFTPTEDDLGLHTVKITVSDGSVNVTKVTNILITYEDDKNELVISNVELTDETGDESVLAPGDTLAISFDIENKLRNALKSIKVSSWLESETGKRLTDKYQFDTFSLEDRESTSLDYKVRIPFNIQDGTKIFIVISAKGVNGETDDTTSTLYITTKKVERQEHKLAFESVSLSESSVECGSIVDLSANIWNVGTETETAYVKVQSAELGINAVSDSFTMKAKGSTANIITTLSLQIPTSAISRNYTLNVLAVYNNNKSAEVAKIPVEVICATPTPTSQGTGVIDTRLTNLTSKAGETTTITLSFRNTGKTSANFEAQLLGCDWCTAEVFPKEFTLAPGENKSLSVQITPNINSFGEKQFTLVVKSNGAIVTSKDFTVTVEKQGIQIRQLNLGSQSTQALLVVLVGLLAAIAILLLGRKKHSAVEIYDEPRRGPGRPPKSAEL